MTQAELCAETEHHDRARAAMATMRRATAGVMGAYEADFVEGRRNRFADDAGPDHAMGHAMAAYGGHRLESLVEKDLPLFFGRLWLDSGEDYHLGRRHVRDEDDRSVPLVVDWRAPLAARFYRASAHDRRGVQRRRRFGFDDSRLTGFEDEDLRLGQEVASDLLTAEIERPRTGPMRDIVATIQPEQDELIRRDADTTVCVQGAPGTGKTAVGLHRAAWLLYTYPDRLRRSGMLVVGPNEGFLRYISAVLPTLGEASVRQTTLESLLGTDLVRGEDTGEAARLKHDARMARVCQRAVWGQLGPVEEELTITHQGLRFPLDVDQLATAVARARATARGWSTGRKTLEEILVQAVVRQYEERIRRPADTRWKQALRREKDLTGWLEQTWPRLTARKVLQQLYTDAELRARACEGLLTVAEQELLTSPRASLRLTTADVVLLDELKGQLEPTTRETVVDHLVLDEAQDLSPMQCRAVARRCGGAMTVLGDLAQGTTPWAATGWASQMEHLARPGAERTTLTTGFRVPGPVIALANRLLPHLQADVPPATSIRRDGHAESVTTQDLAAATALTVQEALGQEGMVGVIGSDADLDLVRDHLPADDRVQLVPARLAKGLEFDHVVLVEPTRIAGGQPPAPDVAGLRLLYVCLTRAVSRLSLVHTMPLPAQLGIDWPMGPAPRPTAKTGD